MNDSKEILDQDIEDLQTEIVREIGRVGEQLHSLLRDFERLKQMTDQL